MQAYLTCHLDIDFYCVSCFSLLGDQRLRNIYFPFSSTCCTINNLINTPSTPFSHLFQEWQRNKYPKIKLNTIRINFFRDLKTILDIPELDAAVKKKVGAIITDAKNEKGKTVIDMSRKPSINYGQIFQQCESNISQKRARPSASSSISTSTTAAHLDFNESDRIYLSGMTVSLASFVGILARNSSISDRTSRYFVTCGMNGVIDLSDGCLGSQLYRLNLEARDELKQKFADSITPPVAPVNLEMFDAVKNDISGENIND